jgi:hypothetical protein
LTCGQKADGRRRKIPGSAPAIATALDAKAV